MLDESIIIKKSSPGLEMPFPRFSAFWKEFVNASYFDLKRSKPPMLLCPLDEKYRCLV